MAKSFVLGIDLAVQRVLGLDKVKQQLSNIQIGGVNQTQNLTTGLKAVETSGANAAIGITKATKATTQLGRSARTTGNRIKDASKNAQTFGEKIQIAGVRYAAFLAATTAAFKAFQLISAGTKSVIEFDKSMISLSQIIKRPVNELSSLSQQFLDLSVATGTSAVEIAEASKLLAQAGFRGNELAEATEQLAKVPLTPIFENMGQAVDGAIAAMRQFASEGLTVETVFDKMINVSNKFAASFPDIIEGLKRGGSAFQAIGGNLDEFIAAFTTIRSVTRESASSVGTSIKTISARLADPKIIKFLETKNIRLIEEGQFVGPLKALRRIGARLENIKSTQEQVNIAVRLGGRRQISRFLAIAQNIDKTNKILDISKDSFGEFDKVAQQGLQGVGKQIDILIAKAKKLAVDLGESLFIPFITGLTGAAEAAITLIGALSPIIPAISKISVAFAGAAIFKGVGGFLGPKLGKLAGPAAFTAAGGGFKGAAAGLGASPFVQAGLLVAASEAAASLFNMSEGANTLTSGLLTSMATIAAAITLFKGQTLSSFASTGGLLPSLGGLGGVLTVGAIAAPFLISEATKSAKELSEKIVNASVKSISDLQIVIDPTDSRSLSDGISSVINELSKAQIESIDTASGFTPRKIFVGLGRTINNILDLDIEAVAREGGLTESNIKDSFVKIIKKRDDFVQALVQNIANTIAAAENDISGQRGRFEPRRQLITATRATGRSQRETIAFTDTVIEAAGGMETFTNRVNRAAKQIREENIERQKLVSLTKNLIPNSLVSQLSQFSRAINKTTKSINISTQLFDTQISEITGGINAPAFDFNFGDQQIQGLIKSGGLEDIFSLTPDIPKFITTFSDIENLLDNFITRVGTLTSPNINILDEVDQFFEFKPDVSNAVKNNFRDFFNTIGGDLIAVSEGQFIDTDIIKSRFKDQFEKLGAGATDAAIDSVRSFLESTFARTRDELNRLATVRQLELDVAVRPQTQARFLEQQLGRSGIRASQFVGSQTSTNPLRRDQRLVDIVGNERLRTRVRDSLRGIVTESSILRKRLADLKPGTEGFTAASERAKDLARSTIELQATMEAFSDATQQALNSELKALTTKQKTELEDKKQLLYKKVESGRISPERAQRSIANLQKEQQIAQLDLQDRFGEIVEKDNQLRVDLAKQISESTKTQGEVTLEFGRFVDIFSASTQSQATTARLMEQNVINFGQAVVNFNQENRLKNQVEEAFNRDISSNQILPPQQNAQQAFAEYNRLIQEGNTTQKDLAEILRNATEILRVEQGGAIKTQDTQDTQKQQENTSAANEKISKLTESMDNLLAVLNEPSQLRLVTDQKIDIDISTLPTDITEEILPLLEEAGSLAAKTVVRKALESLASKSDSEVAIAATDVAQELA